jgi:acetylglutamate kinase
MIADGRIPVISTVARSDAGDVLNVNADNAAAALAVALGAVKIVMLTDVAGLYANWPGGQAGAGAEAAIGGQVAADGRPPEVISELTVSDLAAMLPGLSDGMIPKMEACLAAVRGGVPQAHVLDGRLPHAVLLEVFTDSGIGTMVVPDGDRRAA